MGLVFQVVHISNKVVPRQSLMVVSLVVLRVQLPPKDWREQAAVSFCLQTRDSQAREDLFRVHQVKLSSEREPLPGRSPSPEQMKPKVGQDNSGVALQDHGKVRGFKGKSSSH